MPAMVIFETISGTAFSTLEAERGRSWSFVQEKVIYLEGPDVDSFDPPPSFRFLGNMISAGHIKWNGLLKICGNFEYIPGYWEWAEDVLSRCGHEATNHSSTKTAPGSVCPLGPTIPHRCAWDPHDKYPFDVLDFDVDLEEEVVEVSSSTSGLRRTELVDTRESLEIFVTEVAKSSPPVLPVPSLSQEAADILCAGASSIWSWICTRLEAKSPDIVLKEEAEALSTFQVLARLGLEVVLDLHGKLQDFLRMAREAILSFAVTF
ncbi:hypothetical protein LIER_37080 [Lithospermum erythrorhizon]|uniref:Uncharacterized protein n=1 Tax=Lithospermum erythrorhizon TaxID=34254 RepID=A0AAV3PEP9_LITER